MAENAIADYLIEARENVDKATQAKEELRAVLIAGGADVDDTDTLLTFPAKTEARFTDLTSKAQEI